MRLGLDAAPSRRSMDENGFLHVEGSHISKAAVNPYYGREIPGWEEAGLEPDEVYMGLRDAEELRGSLDSWRGLPLLIEHHIDSADAPQKEARVGTVGTDVAWCDPYVNASLVIWDLRAIQAVEDGSYRELSCAYRYEPDFTAGEWEGQPYDFVMRNIRGNHVALVEEGRAGPDVVVADSRLPRGEHFKPLTRKGIMSHFKDWFRGARDNAMAGNVAVQMDNADVDAALEQTVQGMVEELGLSPAQAEKLLARMRSLTAETATAHTAQDEQGVGCADENPYGLLEEGGELAADDLATSINALLDSVIMNDEDRIRLAEGLLALFQSLTVAGDEMSVTEVMTEVNAEGAAEAMAAAMATGQPVMAGDAALRQSSRIRKAAVNETKALFRALSDAARDVRPVIGDIDPLSFDSADDIYAAALKASGVEPRQYHRSAWRGMFAMLDKQNGFAADARLMERPAVRMDGKFAGLNNIVLG